MIAKSKKKKVVLKKKKNMKGRPRGGASVTCPECGGDSHVIITRRVGTGVVRTRACIPCEFQFTTLERAYP